MQRLMFGLILLLGIAYVLESVPDVLIASAEREVEPRDSPGQLISGTVVDPDGHVVVGAKVRLIDNGRGLTWTNQEGQFTLSVPGPGTYKIIAEKQEAGYAPTISALHYADAGLVRDVVVSGEESVSDVVIRLGPKQAKLVGCVRDAASGKAVLQAAIKVTRANNSDIYAIFSPQVDARKSCFEILVPPGTPVTVEVTAPGYAPWRYGEGNASKQATPIQVELDAPRELNVSLQRSR